MEKEKKKIVQTDRRKVRNTTTDKTKLLYDGIQFKSKLEVNVYKTLTQENLKVDYEPETITLIEGFKPTIPFYSAKKGSLLEQKARAEAIKRIQAMHYTPDFVFIYGKVLVYMEAKGKANETYPIRKKLFRRRLEGYENPVMFFEVKTIKQTKEAIKIIKEYEETL